jgi:hypothetical protein
VEALAIGRARASARLAIRSSASVLVSESDIAHGLLWWEIAAGIDVRIVQLQEARVSPARAFFISGGVR